MDCECETIEGTLESETKVMVLGDNATSIQRQTQVVAS
jgi:hypothetical protein